MEEGEQLRLSIMAAEDANESHSQSLQQPRNNLQWLKVSIYAFFVLAGQSAAMLLGRSYYDNGGNSEWMGTLVQLAGFPILLPYYCFSKGKNRMALQSHSLINLTFICLSLAIVLAADCFLYSVGLKYLPVSTYSLISASQLAFNASFSSFLNSQKFTPYVVNSLVLLTVSSVLIVFDHSSESQKSSPHWSSKGSYKYAIGFVATVAASALYGLMLSITQFAMERVLKRESFSVVVDIAALESFLAACATVVGLFASGEWKGLRNEMVSFKLGKVSYVMTLAGSAISWQAFFIGSVGLILEVSSLFSNAISVLGLPIVPVLAVFFFHERMSGIKAVALVLAIWGFVSYGYQNYLDSAHENGQTRACSEEENDS